MPETNETQIDVDITPGGFNIKVNQPNSQPPTKDTLSTRSDPPPLTELRVRSLVFRCFRFFSFRSSVSQKSGKR